MTVVGEGVDENSDSLVILYSRQQLYNVQQILKNVLPRKTFVSLVSIPQIYFIFQLLKLKIFAIQNCLKEKTIRCKERRFWNFLEKIVSKWVKKLMKIQSMIFSKYLLQKPQNC